MNQTNISWAEMTWNPLSGCTKVSPGCDGCYAERMAWRLANNPKLPAETRSRYQRVAQDGKWTGEVEFFPERLDQPLRAKKPRRIFVCSMSDLFHPGVKDEWLNQIFAVMALCPQHQFLLLTKRPERMREYLDTNAYNEIPDLHDRIGLLMNEFQGLRDDQPRLDCRWPLPNVWLGVTAENQAMADKRIPVLLRIPAAKRFVSLEPLLEPVSLRGYDGQKYRPWLDIIAWKAALDLVITGGQTGLGARPMHPDWVRKVRDDCQAAGVNFHFKQWGEFLDREDIPELKEPTWSSGYKKYSKKPYLYVTPDGHRDHVARYGSAKMIRVGRKRAGHLLDGKEYREWPD